MRTAWGWLLPRARARRYRSAAQGFAWRLSCAKSMSASRSFLSHVQRNDTVRCWPDWRVEGVTPGLWRYSALEHALINVWDEPPAGSPSLSEACFGQTWIDTAAVTFVWTAIPYRTAWRYGADSLKDILFSCGHICQNLYLACESIGAGTCAVVSYNQATMDPMLGVDGVNEMALYVSPVGKVAKG